MDRRSIMHQYILPAIRRADPDEFNLPPADVARSLMESEIFDACDLPLLFVQDTGEAAFEEMRATKQRVRLPYPSCFFDFAGIMQDGSQWRIGIFAEEVDTFSGPVTDETLSDDDWENHTTFIGTRVLVRVWPFQGRPAEDVYETWDVCAEFRNGVKGDDEEDDFFETINVELNSSGEHMLTHGAHLLLGALTLLEEKLVLSQFRPDPEPRLTKARLKRGQYPVTGDSHVLRVNVPAVRAAAKSLGGTHESPCLHWRRGHWRVLHRGSEFEKKAWVNKCLVGDPSKGYASHSYRLQHRFPMLANDNLQPPTEPLGAA